MYIYIYIATLPPKDLPTLMLMEPEIAGTHARCVTRCETVSAKQKQHMCCKSFSHAARFENSVERLSFQAPGFPSDIITEL